MANPRPMPSPVESGTISLARSAGAYVYRGYCRCGDLLYVGVADDMAGRLGGHARVRAEWLDRAIRIEWDLYSTRAIAEQVEQRLISTLDPAFNVIHRGQRRSGHWQDLPWPTFLDPGDTPEERRLYRMRMVLDRFAATRGF